MLKSGQQPPAWLMRPEISEMIINCINQGEEVFYEEDQKKCKVLWFTGLSGSGKTTLALELKKKLEELGKKVEILDGDIVRGTINKHLGFSREDIRENNKIMAGLAKEKMKDSDFVLVPKISPYKEDREKTQFLIGDNFLELFINAPLQECIKRDVKGLYQKALAGEIKDFVGIAQSNPYEAPDNPHLEIKTDQQSLEESVTTILDFLKSRQLF